MHTITRFAFILCTGLLLGAAQHAAAKTEVPTTVTLEPRIALVIGNANYADEMKLANPANDAKLIGAALEKVGFEVILLTDAGQKAMQRAMVDFGERLSKAGPDATGLVYYAGHGLQMDGENYLVPVDADISREADVEINAVPANLVLKQMAFAGSRVNIVILDSCRNNPLAKDFRSVAAAQGFAEIHSKPKGTFISYSTAPGEVAVDGSDGHSPFAAALAEQIQQPGLDISTVFQHVREQVLAATDQKQTPWESSSLVKSFYFVPAPAQPAQDQLIAAASPAAPATPAPSPLLQLASAETPAVPEATMRTTLDGDAPSFVSLDRELYAKSGSRLRAVPSTAGEVVAKLPLNQTLHAVARSLDGAWFQVATVDGRTGYVHSQAVSEFRVAAAPKTTPTAVQQASVHHATGSGTGIDLVDNALGWLASTTGATGKPTAPVTRAQR